MRSWPGACPTSTSWGSPDTAVKEARERVRAAIKNSGYAFPVGRITVNLAPANRRKSGTVYDLPILVGILTAAGQLDWSDPHCAFVGELSSPAPCGRWWGCSPWPWPPGRRGSAASSSRRTAPRRPPWPRASPSTPWRRWASWPTTLAGPHRPRPGVAGGGEEDLPLPDFAEVRGQGPVKRVLEIAAAGGHNVLLVGPRLGEEYVGRRLPLHPAPHDPAGGLGDHPDPLGAGAHHRGAPADPAALPVPHHPSPRGMAGAAPPYPPAGEISLAHHGV